MLFGLSLARWTVILVTALFALLWVQVLLFHYRGGFRRIWMFEPVILAPLLIAFGLLSFTSADLRFIYEILLVLGAGMGLSGLFFHWNGVRRLPDGFTLKNVLFGPPLFLPPVFGVASLVGLVAAYLWR